jgi:UPF0271 protein
MPIIDLNCDVGERPEAIRDGTQDALMACVSSANVACGGHAGDESTMEHTIRSALRHGVAVGAHPGYPDQEGFGRRELRVSPAEIETFVLTQIRSLAEVASRLGASLVHVKPHGALYHAAGRDNAVAEAIARAVARWSQELILVGLAGSPMLRSWEAMGLRVAAEAFADRRYEPDGGLRGRDHPDALVTEPAQAAEQALGIVTGRGVVAWNGTPVAVRADTICIHGDTPGSPAIARAVRARLEAAGAQVKPLR